jgi:hypothetical protein
MCATAMPNKGEIWFYTTPRCADSHFYKVWEQQERQAAFDQKMSRSGLLEKSGYYRFEPERSAA